MLFSPHVPHVSWMCQGAVPELGLGRWKIPLAPRAAAGHVWSLQRLCSELGTGLHGAEHKKGHDGVLWSGSNHGTIFIGYYIYTYYVYVKQITLAAEENPTKVAKCLTLSAERRLTLSNEMNPKASHASRNPQLL